MNGYQNMNHRERELAAIRHEIPDRIPTDAICIENIPSVARHMGITEENVLRRLGLDGRLVGLRYLGSKCEPQTGEAVEEWGTSAFDDYGTAHRYPLARARAVADIENHIWPDPAMYDYASAAQSASELHEEYAVRGPYWQPLFCRVCSLVGMEQALVWMLAEPRLFEAVLDGVFERTFTLCENFVRHCNAKLDIFCLGDDFASQRGMLFDPELWRRFLKPRYARIFDMAKSAGKHVWFHSCGDITAVLPDLIDIGVDVWETVQLHTLPITAEELKRQYGRHIAFFGGVSTQRLPFAEPAEVRAEVERCIRALGEGGGYICGPDHHIKPDVSAQNTVALFQAATEFSMRGYTLKGDFGPQRLRGGG